ncbi:MAG: isocitrate lyase/phosphoenolpyruvate mutase family protein, partial [Pseudomonadota bacterium]|nr:isocitrate lyase/phosphoenolpyruvate mutase family protein [Pseudomonadota bacterium]
RIWCAGINIEDSLPNGSLKEEVSHASLIEAIREELTSAGYEDFFLNARTDTFLQREISLEETLRRAQLYSEAGADGIFVPGMSDAGDIERLVASTNKPVNLMVVPGLDIVAAGAAGVKRISFGNAISDAVISYTEGVCGKIAQGVEVDLSTSSIAVETKFKG